MFSIIIPCYNVGDYLSQTLESVKSQTYQDYEVILVNDGSVDNTKEIALSYCDEDSRFKYIEQENAGVSAARNAGKKISSHQHLYFLDADDRIAPDLLQKAYTVFSNNPKVDMYCFGYDIVEQGKRSKQTKGAWQKDKVVSSSLFLASFLNKKHTQHLCSFIIDSKIGKQFSFPEGMAYGEDQAYLLRVTLACECIHYTPNVFFHYCVRRGSAMNSTLTAKHMDVLASLIELREDFQGTDTYRLYNNYLVYVFISLWINGIKRRGDDVYFNNLNSYSGVLDNVSMGMDRYSIFSYTFKIFYRCAKFVKYSLSNH